MNVSNVNTSISSQVGRDLVFNWSAWISSQHDTVDRAWDVECSNLSVEIVRDGNRTVHVLRQAAWDQLWPRWLEEQGKAENNSILTLQEADLLRNFVALRMSWDGFVTKELAIFPFCVFLHDRFWNSSQAWVATAGTAQALNRSRWSSVWANYTPPFDFSKPSSSASFHYLDADANGLVSESWPLSQLADAQCHNDIGRAHHIFNDHPDHTKHIKGDHHQNHNLKLQHHIEHQSHLHFLRGKPQLRDTCRWDDCVRSRSAECLSCIAGITVQES
eukprot:Skav228113  [mRNA]  locus=scaffold1220:16975:21433:+ [translate_table: standard]